MYLKLILLIFVFLIFIDCLEGTGGIKQKEKRREQKLKRKIQNSIKNFKKFVRFEKDEIKKNEGIENFENVEEIRTSSSPSKGKEHIKQKKKVLYIGDNFFFSHIQFNDMLLYENPKSERSVTSRVFNVINMPIDSTRFDENQPLPEQIMKYRFSNKFRHVGIYQEVITNAEVYIDKKKVRILDWLLDQNYDFGVAEFEVMAGSFAVFHALGIKKTFNVANTVFFPKYLQLLDIDGEPIDFEKYIVPEFYSVEPGDWDENNGICNQNSNRYRENLENHKQINQTLMEEYELSYKIYEELYNKCVNDNEIKKPLPIGILFKNINFHFINQNIHGVFETFPKLENIMYIGGLVVEEQGKLIQKKVKRDKPPCVVYVSFGSRKVTDISNIFGEGVIKQMIAEFQKYNKCIFKARLEERFSPKSNRNTVLTEGSTMQQNILVKSNTKLFISHCGVNGLNESMYAGIPLICIPWGEDQPYNGSLAEHKGIGILVKPDNNFGHAFKEALNNILNKNYDSYQNAINKIRKEIHNNLNQGGFIKNKFIEKIAEIIN
uniref:glucuronosyltransferase n=1 Tax=Meloidogyne hapla TaxID=6305 RepID=A0A1I8BAR8_MELHA